MAIFALSRYLLSGCFMLIPELASAGVDLAQAAHHINNIVLDTKTLAEVITYATGSAYAFSAANKFKRHHENPQFIPLGTPLVETMVAASLFAFPTLASRGGYMIFEHHYVDPYVLREERLLAEKVQDSPYPPQVGKTKESKLPKDLLALYTK